MIKTEGRRKTSVTHKGHNPDNLLLGSMDHVPFTLISRILLKNILLPEALYLLYRFMNHCFLFLNYNAERLISPLEPPVSLAWF